MEKIITIYAIAMLAFFSACEKNQEYISDNYLSGTWTEHVPDGKFYFEATLHSFSFNADSFTAKIISWTDAIIVLPEDPCSSNGVEEKYIRGTYSISNDSIYFSGKLCDSLYQHEQATCYGISDYNERFRFTKNDTAIILNEDSESIFGYGIILRKEE